MNWLGELFNYPDNESLLIYGSFNISLVLLSVLVAMYASCIGFQVAAQARLVDRSSSRHHLTLLAGSIALGGGVWSMHFIGMLAFNLFTPVEYAIGLTLLSMLPSIGASWIALNLIVKKEIHTTQLLIGGVLVGAGIGTMHYSGMAAMQMTPMLRYDPGMFALSILVAVILAVISLWIRFGIDQVRRIQLSELQLNLISGAVMGVAISGMHYTGMAAARFVHPEAMTMIEDSGEISMVLAVGVSVTTIAITSLVLTVNLAFRYKDISELASENEGRLIATMDTAVDGIITINSQGFVIASNRAIENILGWSQEELLDKNVNMLMPEPHRSNHDGYLERYLTTGKANIIGISRELEALHKDGHTVPVRIAIGHVKLPAENLFVGFISDITQRIAMEHDLRKAKEKAEQAAVVRQVFLANMSHEIRTPMNAIIGFSDVLLDTKLDQNQRQYLETVNNSARSLLHLLDEILDIAKLEKGKVILHKHDFLLAEEVDHIISTLWVQATKKGLELELDYSDQLALVYYGASDRIRQVLTNLLNNAIKFTEKGKVSLEVKPDGDGYVQFRITDTGIGIPQDRLEAIFDVFIQADASTNRRYGGTGLGTSISKQLVELMGGTISATSEVGIGSCFSFRLPLPLGRQDKSVEAKTSIQLPPLSILVVDDIQQNIDLLSVMLTRAGHTVVTARDGRQAIKRFEQNKTDVILMDVQMPTMDGLAASRLIRETQSANGDDPVPIIALTASVFEQDQQAAYDAGMNGFVAKPVDYILLCHEIAKVLDLRQFPRKEEGQHGETHRLLDEAKGVELWGSLEFYVAELNKFLTQQATAIHELQKALDGADWVTTREQAHKFKGLCGNLALSALTRLFSRLEEEAGSINSSAAKNVMNEIVSCIIALEERVNGMKAELNSPSQTVKPVNNPAALDDLKEKLLEAARLNQYDEQLVRSLVQHVDIKQRPLADKIITAFDNFKFRTAIKLLDQLTIKAP